MAATTAHPSQGTPWAQAGDCARSILANPHGAPAKTQPWLTPSALQVFAVRVPHGLSASNPTKHKHPGRSKGHFHRLLWHSWHS